MEHNQKYYKLKAKMNLMHYVFDEIFNKDLLSKFEIMTILVPEEEN